MDRTDDDFGDEFKAKMEELIRNAPPFRILDVTRHISDLIDDPEHEEVNERIQSLSADDDSEIAWAIQSRNRLEETKPLLALADDTSSDQYMQNASRVFFTCLLFEDALNRIYPDWRDFALLTPVDEELWETEKKLREIRGTAPNRSKNSLPLFAGTEAQFELLSMLLHEGEHIVNLDGAPCAHTRARLCSVFRHYIRGKPVVDFNSKQVEQVHQKDKKPLLKAVAHFRTLLDQIEKHLS